MAELIKSITTLDPKMIDTRDRLRPASRSGVDAIKTSIVELGNVLQDPIHLRKMPDGSFRLILGLHRLGAVLELEWSEIPVVVWKCTDDWARMMEVDDNLAGSDLTAIDTAVFLARRKAVFERMHPETKTGHAGAAARWNAADIVSVASFAAATAEKFNMSERHVRRLISVGNALSKNEIDWLRGSDNQVTLSDLQTIAKIGEPKDRSAVCKAVGRGTAKNASAALKVIKNGGQEPPIKDPVEVSFADLKTRWRRAPKPAKRRFVDAMRVELNEMLTALESAGAK